MADSIDPAPPYSGGPGQPTEKRPLEQPGNPSQQQSPMPMAEGSGYPMPAYPPNMAHSGSQSNMAPPPPGGQPSMPPQSYPMGPYPPGGANLQQQSNQGTSEFRQAVPISALTSQPAPVDCPRCGARKMTKVYHESGQNVYLWALLATAVCCCCVPFMMDDLKDTAHYCSNCNVHLATFKRGSGVEQMFWA